jgi:hypothetical protein
MSILNTEPRQRIRIHGAMGSLEDGFEYTTGRSTVNDAIDYHDGNDRYHIKAKMAERYAVEYVREEAPSGKVTVVQRKSKRAIQTAIDNEMYEVVVRGMSTKVSGLVATLAEDGNFAYTSTSSDGGDPKRDDDAKRDIEEDRNAGAFAIRLARVDDLSVLNESSVMYIQVLNGRLNYQPVPADKVFVVFGDSIQQSDKYTDLRAVDRLELEDALAVILQLSDKKFAAYFGRSDIYPDGRFVQYESESWSTVPDVNSAEAEEYLNDAGDIANPLTMLQNSRGNYSTPEYPIVIWYGSNKGTGKTIMPISNRLFESSREVDLSASRVSFAANVGARGAWFFQHDAGASPSQPESFGEGIAVLKAGQSAVVLTVPSSNIEVAEDVNNNAAAYLADMYGVPAYMSGVLENTQVHSGAALMEMNRPLNMIKHRRFEINEAGMSRIWDIERALASIETGEDVYPNTTQVWTVKPLQIFKTETEKLEEMRLKKELEIVDNADILVEIDDTISDRGEAMVALEKLQTSAPEPEVANTTANRVRAASQGLLNA